MSLSGSNQTPKPPKPIKQNHYDVAKKPKTFLSNIIKVPKFISDRFVEGTEESKINLPKLESLNTVFGHIYLQFQKYKLLISQIQNLIKDNTAAIDRNIKEIEKKNNKIDFMSYSENFVHDSPHTNPILKHTVTDASGDVTGVIFDEDSGLESVLIQEGDRNFIKINWDETILEKLKFTSSGSVKISWDAETGSYLIEQNDTLLYTSQAKETEIVLDHNLGTRALDVKTFKLVDNDLDLKTPIHPGIEYPSDNQVRIYLTEAIKIQVLITRI